MRTLTVLYLVFFYSFQSLLSQEKYKISASYTEETISLDGIDNEVSWSKASMISDEFNGLIPIPENKGSQKMKLKLFTIINIYMFLLKHIQLQIKLENPH